MSEHDLQLEFEARIGGHLGPVEDLARELLQLVEAHEAAVVKSARRDERARVCRAVEQWMAKLPRGESFYELLERLKTVQPDELRAKGGT